MAFREVSVTEIRKVLRLWVRGEGLRSIERLVSCDRKTIRRCVQAAEAASLARDGGVKHLTDADRGGGGGGAPGATAGARRGAAALRG